MSVALRVLYAEDNALDADLTRARLSDHGSEFDLEIVGSGQECLGRLSSEVFDLVLLDYRLPDMEGLDVLKALVHRGAQLPVVLVTGSGDEDLVVKALRLGAANYVSKTGTYLETLPTLLRSVANDHQSKHLHGVACVGARRILYVEHHPMDIDLTLRHFAEAAPQFELEVVRSCAEALARLARPPRCDAALVDLRMPDQSGLDFVAEAKRKGLPLPPFVMISGKGDEEAAIASLTLGAADYVAKRDGYLEQLPYTVDRAIAYSRLSRANAQLQAELTERRITQAALDGQRQLLNTLLDAMPVPVFYENTQGQYVGVNQAFERYFGKTQRELVGKTVFDVAPQELAEIYDAKDKELFRCPGVQVYETKMRDHPGRLRDVVYHKATYKDSEGEVAGIVGAILDVTERKKVEEELRFRNAILSTQQETSVDGILVVDGNGQIVSFNRRFAEMWNISVEALSTLSDREVMQSVLGTIVRSEQFVSRVEYLYANPDVHGQDEVVLKDGRILERYSAPMRGEHGHYFGRVWYFRDITARQRAEEERRSLEEQLLASQKMEAIGSLAGGVAHDFNNLLSVILNYTGFAIDEVPEGSRLREDLCEVKKAGERAATLTRQLLAFSRKQVLNPELLSLNQVAEDIEKMLRRILGEDIAFLQVLAPDLGLTLADRGQIEQVLLNLVVNARDAMANGGKLTIETSNVELDGEYATHHMAVTPGSYVQLAVTDTGCGMDEPTRARIFEPFFTTKELGKGTGLGLSTVYGIVKQSGGNIWVYSEVGKGTTFKIYLPRASAATTSATTPSPPPDRSARTSKSETILVVEDEEALRKVARRALESVGHTVLTAAGGEQALALCAQYEGEIHLLLTDVVMPGMNGRALAQELVKNRPGLQVIYTSGYADNAIAHHGALDPGTHFLPKPLSSVELNRKVREVLDLGRRS